MNRRGLAFWKLLQGPAMVGLTLLAYFWAKPLNNGFQVPEAARIIFWHVPMAMLGLLWFFVAGYHAVRFLFGRGSGDLRRDSRVSFACEVGLACTLLATFSGMIFAQVQWRTPWNWDPKQVSILVLIMIYVAYFGLRMSVDEPQLRARLTSAYAILGAVAAPLLMYVVPHLPQVQTLHPTQVLTGGLDSKWRLIWMGFTVVFLGVTAWLFELRVRLAALEARRSEAGDPEDQVVVEAVRRPSGGATTGAAG